MKIISAQTLQREATARAKAELEQRQRAERILTPEALASSRGKSVTAAKKLFTTLGGKVRPITTEDLRAFKIAVQQLQARRQHVAGITVADVLAGSRDEDVQRAKTEIFHSVPYRIANGVVHFQVSASRQSKDNRHQCQVELTGWQQAVGSPLTPVQAAKVATEQPIKIACSCGRWQFWYRYIATVGGWGADRPETGLPKIRNPELTGVACKHLLRTVGELSSTLVSSQIGKAIAMERQRLAGRTKKTVHVVDRTKAETAVEKQAAKPRDLTRLAAKFQKLLHGKAPAAARRPPTAESLQREVALARVRLAKTGMTKAQIEQVAAAILAAGVAK